MGITVLFIKMYGFMPGCEFTLFAVYHVVQRGSPAYYLFYLYIFFLAGRELGGGCATVDILKLIADRNWGGEP